MLFLLGVSRTSKTPTSIYLANRGYKVANIPIIPETKNLPLKQLNKKFKKKHVLLVLFVITTRLLDVRRNRVQSMHEDRRQVIIQMKKK